MTFKLGDQLDRGADPNISFALYRSYIDNNRKEFPESALNVLDHPNWVGGSASMAPMHGQLISLDIGSLGSQLSNLTLKLRKDVYVSEPFFIALNYKKIFQVDISCDDDSDMSEPWRWRYDQFLFTHHRGEKMFTHQIEWGNGVVWSITAGEIYAIWE